MRKSRYSDSQIMSILRQNENGVSVPDLWTDLGFVDISILAGHSL